MGATLGEGLSLGFSRILGLSWRFRVSGLGLGFGVSVLGFRFRVQGCLTWRFRVEGFSRILSLVWLWRRWGRLGVIECSSTYYGP